LFNNIIFFTVSKIVNFLVIENGKIDIR